MFFDIFKQGFSVLRDSCCSCGCKCGCDPNSVEDKVRAGGSGAGATKGAKTASGPSA